MIRPIWSPTVSGISHQPSPQARIPRSFHVRAYSRTRSSAASGIAPSEWLMRYVVCARIGNSSRYEARSRIVGEYSTVTQEQFDTLFDEAYLEL